MEQGVDEEEVVVFGDFAAVPIFHELVERVGDVVDAAVAVEDIAV
jgi:hypothetical protein